MQLHTALIGSQHCGLNLSFEEWFLRSVNTPDVMYLFFYENTDAMVLGKSLELEQEIHTHKKHPPVYRRISGGGSVLHTAGNLNYALYLPLETFPELMNVSLSYQRILGGVIARFPRGVSIQGYSDLNIVSRGEPRKFSGNAQCRKRGWILHHGTLLYDKEAIRRVPWYLRPPPKEPAYRRGRRHSEFMTNVLPFYNRAALMRDVRLGLAKAFDAELRAIPDPLKTARGVMNPPFQSERNHQ